MGAAKAKDISKIATDYSGYVNLVKDAVSDPLLESFGELQV